MQQRRSLRLSRSASTALLVVIALTGIAAAAVGVSASSRTIESAIATTEQLASHNVNLNDVPPVDLKAVITAETAGLTAQKLVDAPKLPEEAFRVMVSEFYDGPKKSAWLLMFTGGSFPGSGGPVEGAESREFATDFTGVLIDDQTGEIIRWFQGWHFTP
jgi:hypothetical protein